MDSPYLLAIFDFQKNIRMPVKNPTTRGFRAELEALLPQCMLQERKRLEKQLHKLLRRHRNPHPRELERLVRRAEKSARLLQERRRNLPALTYPEELPITALKDQILRAIHDNPVVIVAGETGSGKTTQIPKICLEAGLGLKAKIACTQPRRVAALSLSRRIAEELQVGWGREVGCKIRFKDQTAPQTLIKMMTDGMLLAEIQNDPQLLEYDTVIVDEAHERSLNIDYLLGYLRLLRRRPDLKIVITSATIDTEAFSKAFDNAPVVQVSGRMYPVEVRYWPLDELLEESGDYTYIDAAVSAVEEIFAESRDGDILLFMPTEKDIHETRDLLAGRRFDRAEILPLFGRLTAAEQQRVFAPQARRRIVVSTNVAETSLTIPGIHYVIDTGLARLSRYNPRTQTQRLPVEPISQSSAEQRKGRCGRLSGGICIRLYEETDLLARPPYTQPEIQRANLAQVILHMLALKLGDVERFPFVDPPTPQAIRGGFLLLEELGALDGQRRLTRLGRAMARLPIAPTVARMVLQAQEEGALREVLVIAAVISIQDPRERPQDKQEQADQMHRPFLHPQSDFLAFLNIWDAYHDQLEEKHTQNQMRKFCRSHFLSYMRMREWRDIHVQLTETLREIGGFRWNQEAADYDAVHRAVVSGLLSNIARKKEFNFYQAARDREAMLFPGSSLFQPKGKSKDTVGDKTPEWVMAAEMVETSRLFARTCARINPAWLEELGGHLCRATHKDPYWNEPSGRVLVRETLTLYGLEVLSHQIPYQRVNPVHSTEIFIREALIGDQIHAPHPFLEHNRRLYHKIETYQTRLHRHHGPDLEEVVYQFYARHLKGVSSIHDLNRVVRENRAQDPRFLFMRQEDLLDEPEAGFDERIFPDTLTLDQEELALSYAYRPGQDDDGITLKIPYKLIHAIQPEVLEWLVPGFLEEKITHLLRSLPKDIRKQLVPIPVKARQIAAELRPTHTSFLEALEVFIQERYRIQIRRLDWKLEGLPDHLRMRIEVQGTEGRPVGAGRDLQALAEGLEQHDTPVELEAWKRAAAEWDQGGLKTWSFGDLPERVEITAVSGVPVYGFPGLRAEEDSVRINLFKTREEAEAASRGGLLRLCELALQDELKWLRRELVELDEFKELYKPLGSAAELRGYAFEHLERYLFFREDLYPLTASAFEQNLARARKRFEGLALGFIDRVDDLLQGLREIRLHPHSYPGMEEDLKRLLPKDFLLHTPHAQLPHLHRYLKAILVRAGRARAGAGKDAQKARQVQPYQEALDQLLQEEAPPPRRHQQIEALRWMVEEYRVSIFAQELGTAHSISPQRLDKQLEEIERRQ